MSLVDRKGLNIMENEDVEMKELRFKGYYINAMGEGVKTSTIRKYCNLKVGEQFKITYNVEDKTTYNIKDNNNVPYDIVEGFDKLLFEVTNITRISWFEITDEIALKEGYTHKDILKAKLKRSFNYVDDSELFYQIEFKRVD